MAGIRINFKKIWLSVIMALVVLGTTASLISVEAFAEEDSYGLVDDQIGVFSSSEVEELLNKASDAAGEMSMNVAVVLSEDIEGKSPQDYSDDYYDDSFGINTDGVLVLINNDTKVDYISTSGQGILYFDDDRIQKIHDACQPYLRDGDYYGAVEAYLDTLVSYYTKGVPSSNRNYMIDDEGQYVENPDPSGTKTAAGSDEPFYWLKWSIKSSSGMLILVAVAIGLVAGGVTLLVIKLRYGFKSAPSAGTYLENVQHNMWRQRDIYLGTHVSRTKIESESSGGGSSTHTSSGGGTHGGGGSSR